MSSAKTVDISVKGRQYTLHLEEEAYNGKPAWYITDQNLSALFDGQIPDDLVLFETANGVQCSPKVITLEGQEITTEIWKALKGPETDSSTPQPFGPGLG
jgi:hypothetical protein